MLSVFGLTSTVLGDDGAAYQCATRRILKTLSTEERNPVVAGDRVLFRPGGGKAAHSTSTGKGTSRFVGTKRDVPHSPARASSNASSRGTARICRAVRGRQQVLVANVDQLLIVASVGRAAAEAEPDRPHAGRRRERAAFGR